MYTNCTVVHQYVTHTRRSEQYAFYYRDVDAVKGILEEDKMDGYGTEKSCKSIQKLLSDNDGKMGKSTVQLVGMVGVIATAGISILKELIQLGQSGAAYFKNLQNIIELGTCILAIIFVVSFTEFNTTVFNSKN